MKFTKLLLIHQFPFLIYISFSTVQIVYLPFGGAEKRIVWTGDMESSKQNVYYSDFVNGDFSKHETIYIKINTGFKKTLRSHGGVGVWGG